MNGLDFKYYQIEAITSMVKDINLINFDKD
jgi:hypothetical protein